MNNYISNNFMSELDPLSHMPGGAMKTKLYKITALVIVFVLSLPFEMLNNLIVLSFLPFYLYRLKFRKWVIVTIIILLLLLIPFYLISFNGVYLKYWTQILRMLILVSLFNYIFKAKLKSFELKPIIDKVFYLHVFCFLLCFISPRVSGIVANIFSHSIREMNFRISGFFSGFDIVSFFIVVYLTYDYLGTGKTLTRSHLIKILLGTFAISLTGRFGVISLAIFMFYIILKLKNIKWMLLVIPVMIAVSFSGFIDDRIEYIGSTIKMLLAAIDDIDNVDNSAFEGTEFQGQFNQSPLTWYYEFRRPFMHIGNYLFPGNLNVVDSGPSFFVLNFGLFLGFFLYFLYFQIFRLLTNVHIPFLVVCIFLVGDLKFRLLYSLMPLMWLIVNHLSYIQQIEKVEPKTT